MPHFALSRSSELSEQNFLDHYFGSVYDKLEADALLFNRQIPHAGMSGAENELALSELLRQFLPPRFGIEVSGILIDRFGRESRQIDIVIYDAWTYPKYLRKIFPVEVVHAVVEVKTTLTRASATASRENLKSVFDLEFRPELTPYWENRAKEDHHVMHPPVGVVFGYRSEAVAYETFAEWFPFATVLDGIPLRTDNGRPDIRAVLIGCLDKGIISMSSQNLHVTRFVSTADPNNSRRMPGVFEGKEIMIDPAKSLFLFLETLWHWLCDSAVHPGFDIRSYLSRRMNRLRKFDSTEEAPPDWYAASTRAPE